MSKQDDEVSFHPIRESDRTCVPLMPSAATDDDVYLWVSRYKEAHRIYGDRSSSHKERRKALDFICKYGYWPAPEEFDELLWMYKNCPNQGSVIWAEIVAKGRRQIKNDGGREVEQPSLF